MTETVHGDLTLLRFDRLSREPGVIHAFTTRPQNFAPHRGQGREQAVHWRQEVCRLLGVPLEKLTSPEQVHGGEVIVVEASDVGCGRDGRGSAVRFVDGLVTNRPGVPLILMSADCPLVCAYDPVSRVIGAVHSSWQGTVAHATTQMIRMMQREFACDPADIRAAISPSAGPCCYEVGEDVRRMARTKLEDAEQFFPRRNSRMTFDLWASNRRQLLDTGVQPDHIEIAGLCSICNERFWSHRRDGGDAGRSALFIGLTEREGNEEAQMW